jgi:hypothetical protein
MRRIVLMSVMFAAVLGLAACIATNGTVTSVGSASTTTTQTIETARRLDFYQSQASLLGRALEDRQWQKAWEATETGPVPKNGAFTARILDVSEASATITFNRIGFFVGGADKAARADGKQMAPGGYYVRDRVRERRALPVADGAVIVVYFMNTDWVEGDLFTETETGLPVVAMDLARFAKRYGSDSYMRAALQDVGAVGFPSARAALSAPPTKNDIRLNVIVALASLTSRIRAVKAPFFGTGPVSVASQAFCHLLSSSARPSSEAWDW